MKFILIIMVMSNLAFAEVSQKLKEQVIKKTPHELALMMKTAIDRHIDPRKVGLKSKVIDNKIYVLTLEDTSTTEFNDFLKRKNITANDVFIYKGYKMLCKDDNGFTNLLLKQGMEQHYVVYDKSKNNKIILTLNYTKELCDKLTKIYKK